MSKPRILVARAIFPDIVDRLRAHFDVEIGTQRLFDILADADLVHVRSC